MTVAPAPLDGHPPVGPDTCRNVHHRNPLRVSGEKKARRTHAFRVRPSVGGTTQIGIPRRGNLRACCSYTTARPYSIAIQGRLGSSGGVHESHHLRGLVVVWFVEGPAGQHFGDPRGFFRRGFAVQTVPDGVSWNVGPEKSNAAVGGGPQTLLGGFITLCLAAKAPRLSRTPTTPGGRLGFRPSRPHAPRFNGFGKVAWGPGHLEAAFSLSTP